MHRYHNNAVTTAQVIEELIKLAQEMRAAKQRVEELGLNPDEMAFYDALAESESAVE
jgi:type I restriction enzyme, R subunit